MISLSRTCARAIPALLVGALVLAGSADAHPRHREHRKHGYRAPQPVWVERTPVCAVPRAAYRPARVVYGGAPYPPAGYLYVDPWCGDAFVSARAYRHHARRHDHPAYLTVVSRGPSCRYEGYSDE